MRVLKERTCNVCSSLYVPTGSCSKYCSNCREQHTILKRRAAVKAWSIKNGIYKGTGSGSSTKFAEGNPGYKHGKSVFDRWAVERLESIGMCERCGVRLDRSKRGSWAGHHKDHSPNNNVISNLELLCRRCHAIEHECWKSFEGATTMVERDLVTGRYKRIEAPYTINNGDDIV